MNKKKVLLIILAIIIIVGIVVFSIFKIYNHFYFKYDTVVDGDTTKWEKYYPENDAYELAFNSRNLIAFKNPDKALNQLKKDYKEAINAIQQQFNISSTLSKYNYQEYATYGWQLNTEDESLYNDARFITVALHTYANNFVN